jgi:hypothetical protein
VDDDHAWIQFPGIQSELTITASHYRRKGQHSVVAVGLAHAPMWGWAAAVIQIFSGGIVAVISCGRQDILDFILAQIATDLYGTLLAPHLAPRGSDMSVKE